MLIDDVAGVVGDLIHQIRGHQFPAIGNGGNGADLLNRRYVEVLTESVNGKVQPRHFRGEDTATLARQVDTGLFPVTERLYVFGVFIHAHPFAKRHEPYVAGLLKSHGKGNGAVTGGLMAMNPVTEHDLVAGTAHRFGKVYFVFLQRHGGGNDLESGTGDVALGHRLVGPHGGEQISLQVAVFLRVHGVSAGSKLFTGDRIHRPRVVQVEAARRRHCQNGSGLDVHHDSARTVLRRMVGNRLLQLLLQKVLYRAVNGRMQIVAVHGFNIAGVVERHFVSVGISRLNVVSVNAAQIFIILIFQSVKSHAVTAGESQDVRRQRVCGVIAGVLSFQIHHGLKLVCVDEFPHPVGGFFVNLSLYGTVQISGVLGRLLVDRIVRNAEQFGQSLCDHVGVPDVASLLQRILRTLNGGRRYKRTVGCNIGGKHVAVGIVYFSSIRRHRRFGRHLIYNL